MKEWVIGDKPVGLVVAHKGACADALEAAAGGRAGQLGGFAELSDLPLWLGKFTKNLRGEAQW